MGKRLKKIKAKLGKRKHLGVILVLIVLLIATIFYKEREAKLLFVGDMMFDRYIRQVMYEKGEDYIFSCKDFGGRTLSDFLKSYDLVVGNLEGPITENASVSMFTKPENSNNYTFTFPTNTAKLLAKNNIKLVNLGNNHINNFGERGIASTKKFLSEAGVSYFGLPGNRESLIEEEDLGGLSAQAGSRVSFVAYNEFGAISVNDVIEKIKSEKEKGRTIIVFAHWGDEYVPIPQRVKNIAKKFADAGADFIIGSHPHIILGNEEIHSTSSGQVVNTTVYYSLGNFIFDQYWNKEVSTGLALELKIKNGKISTVEHKISMNSDGRTCLID